ncbi:MAG: mechanosensitive ion channel domain-containing protein, partial [Cyclobacteriaceae bacterium]
MKFSIEKAIGILKDKIEAWLEGLTSMLPNLVVAIIVFILFYIIAGFAKKLAKNLLDRISDKKSLNNLFGTFINLLIIGIGFMIALNILNLDQAVTSLLAGAGIVGLALGFAFQDITANFISGVLIALRKPIQVGDIIETDGHTGVVEEIDLRVTVIRTFPGLHVIVPNKDVFQSSIINYTRTNERRVDLAVGVS